ncbi:PREDICTED: uncharacterized protein LOC104710258 isoform X2 [Camelina sativa]|uniref:Uncharacterized protein LOC104710258 isoform X2 n=1 Tax=Camelina sativa TaxID=90675 RepID=A0ABM0TEE4_CAMSA|nr:PREDICTED: uncharacterized protein LOC104710258 isoform X2 [Camelina sativa]
MVESLLKTPEQDLGKKGRVTPTRKIELKEAVYKFDRKGYRSVKKKTSSGSWRLTTGPGADKVIDADWLTDSNWLTDGEKVSKGIAVLRTRQYYQGDAVARVLTPWIMYELHVAFLNPDQVDFVRRTYVICNVSYTGEQGGDVHKAGPDEELSPPCEEVLAPTTVFTDNNCPNAQGLFITEEAIDRNRKKPPHTYLNNLILGIILLLALTGKIISSSVSLENSKVTNTSGLCESCRCFNQANSNSSSSISGQTETNRATFLIHHFTSFHSLFMSYMTVSPAKKVHQVFLNFRGEELRYNFVSHLGDAFERHNIKLFVDKYEQRGKDLKNLFVRIEESSIALAIFSTRYPESRWCMDELVKMNKLADLGKLRVIPIFYKVEAGDVRKQTGDSEFGKNFWRLAEASSGDQIKKWKEALEGITNKMGLSLGDNSVESDSVKEIVEGVQRVIELIGLEEEVRSPI